MISAMAVLRQHTRFDVMELEREAAAFAERVARGDHPKAEECRLWVAKLERLANEPIDVDLIRVCLVGLNAIVAGMVPTMNEATWKGAQLWLLHLVRHHHFRTSDVADSAYARFVSEALRLSDARQGDTALSPHEFPKWAERDVRRAIARLVDDGLGHLEYDHKRASFVGGFYVHSEQARDWLQTNATNPGEQATVTVFWSWQSDLRSECTRDLIQHALEKAAKRVAKSTALVVTIDRDTQGRPGMPNIAETILAKIVEADVFVWDASLVTRSHTRSAPNPNVLFELGFAVAALGWDRMVGVMNEQYGGADELPFDLRHRRWPLRFRLEPRPWWARVPWFAGRWKARRKEIRDALIESLATAIAECLQKPKGGALRSDPDGPLAQRLWERVDSAWLHNWYEWRRSHPQFEDDQFLKVLDEYVTLSRRPEKVFRNHALRQRHEKLLQAIREYLMAAAREMVPMGDHRYVISTKADGERRYIEDYDARYERQVSIIEGACDHIWEAWTAYVQELRERFPAVAHAERPREAPSRDRSEVLPSG